jgi:hypothetical protein
LLDEVGGSSDYWLSPPFVFTGAPGGVLGGMVAFTARNGAVSGGGAWCMVTIIARDGFFPAHR